MRTPDNRLTGRLDSLTGKLLVPFLTAGYPSDELSLDLSQAAIEAGADILELGMPFSDPMADGPEIQHSSHRALAGGTNLTSVLLQVEAIHSKSNIPVVLMGYLNPVHAYGVERFCSDAVSAGVDGLIVPDLPVDEAAELMRIAGKANLALTFLVAPTTPPGRLNRIDRASTGFVYAVTVTGVTGTGKVFDQSTDKYLSKLRQSLSRPFVAGFGVSDGDSARRLTRFADGVVIGSALVRAIRDAGENRNAVRALSKVLGDIRKSIP